MSDPVLLNRLNEKTIEITLNRPAVMNAMSIGLVRRLCELFRELSDDPDPRAIILTGAGRAFCGGLDLKEMSQPGAFSELVWHGPDSLFSIARSCRHPIITAVNGYTITGGLELALMGDFLIASDQAMFADTHARVGITPSWGLTQILPRLVGINRARQMSLTGEFIDATRACEWGLVNEVVPHDQLMERARALAGEIGETDQKTMTSIRELIVQGSELGFSDALALEAGVFDTHIAELSSSELAERRIGVTQRGRRLAGKDS